MLSQHQQLEEQLVGLLASCVWEPGFDAALQDYMQVRCFGALLCMLAVWQLYLCDQGVVTQSSRRLRPSCCLCQPTGSH